MKKKVVIALLAMTLGGTIVFQNMDLIAEAVISNRDNGVKSVHVSDSEIENSTLVIGSYLIHIDGLTDEIYELAQASANEFDQNVMYYKSELADGQWYEITDATSIADITSGGTPVDASEIETLNFTHKVDSSGTITDLRTGKTVGAYDINDPYDLENLEELEPLKLRYQAMGAKDDKSDEDDTNISTIANFFGINVKNSTTNDSDSKLSALETYKNGLITRDKPSSWTTEVDTVAASVDATRRLEVLNTIEKQLIALQNDATVQSDSELVQAIAESQSNVESSITSYTAKELSEGTTVLTKAVYNYSNDMITCANSGDLDGADTATENLVNLENIMQSTIANSSSELETLNSGLVDDAFSEWESKLSAGASSDYQKAVSNGSSESVRTSYLTTQQNESNSARQDYQTLLSESWKRMSNEKAQEDCMDRIDGVADLEALVPEDAAQSYQLETVEEHLNWLRTELANLVAEFGDSSDLDNLNSEIEDLETERRNALDKNDLASAKKLETEIEAKQQDLDDLTKELTDVLNSDSSSESDKAKAAAGLSDGSAAKMLNTLASAITSGIRDGSDTSGTENQMAAFQALSSYDPSAAAAGLSDIKDALDGATSIDDDLKDQLSQAVSEVEQEVGDGTTSGEDLTTDELKNLLADYFGSILGNGTSEVSDRDMAAALIALSMYAEDADNSDARALAVSIADKMNSAGNSYIYKQYSKASDEYISLRAISKVLGYRYIFDSAHYTVTLRQSYNYYRFTKDKLEYTYTEKAVGSMQKAAGLMETLYISSLDGESIFNCTGYYIPKSSYASVKTSNMESLIQEVYQMLMEGGA